MKKILLLTVMSVLISEALFAQTRTVTGRVTSAVEGEGAMPGVTVTAKGTTTGTLTDVDGNYTLQVPQGVTTLVFSYIGMKTQEIEIGGRTQINVTLESDLVGLSEVVVTAFGISRERKALGYAVQDVSSDELTQAASTSLGGALQGKISGVEIQPSSGMPGASSKITIRGSRSFTDNNTPLYVIDGMPITSTADVSTGNSVTGADYANRAIDLDPNDIESINVLKGQAASALYGMRASNGVIVITTRSGAGLRSENPEITLNSNYSFDILSTLPDLQNQFAQGTGGNYNPAASTSWGPRIEELPNSATHGGNTVNANTNRDGMHQGMYYVPQRAAAGLDPWTAPQAYDNVGAFFDRGMTFSNSLNVAQGFSRGDYSFSLGNVTSKGVVPSTGMDRYNIKLGANAKLGENWSTGFTGNFILSEISKQSSANNGVVATVYPAPPSYDLAGIPSHIEGDPFTQNNYRGTAGFDAAYWAIENNSFTENLQRFFGNAYVRYSTKLNTENHTLDLKYQIGDDAYTTNYTDLWGYGHANLAGEVDHYNYSINELNSLLTGNWSWEISPRLDFDLLLGNELVHRKTKFVESYGRDFNFPGWNHVNNASVYQASESFTRNRTVGVFGSLSLAFADMLFLNVTGRNDVVSSMPRNNRSFFYPSVSLGWVFTELASLDNEILSFGKLRLSYAEVGQAGVYFNTFYSTPVYGGGFSSGTPITYPIGTTNSFTLDNIVYDPGLKPQNTTSYEIGADFSFWDNVLSLSYTYSRQNVVDQIFQVPLAGSTGSGSLVTNGGSIHTNTHEVTLGIQPFNTENAALDFTFNFSKIDNYVDELAPGVNSIFLGGFVEPQVRAGIGAKFPVIYGVSYLRNEEGQIVVDQNGFPQPGDERVIGIVSPDFILGLNSNLELYKFRLNALLHWKEGGQMYSGTSGLLDFYGISQRSADYRTSDGFMFGHDAVKVTGEDAGGNPIYAPNDIVVPGSNAQAYFSAENNISESMIYDNSFLKLREVSLSYPVFNQPSFSASLSLFARNILLWTTFKGGLDPEATQGNNNMSGAFERFSLPGASSYGIGLNVKF